MYRDVRSLTDAERESEIRKLKLNQFSFGADLQKKMRLRNDLDLQSRDLKRKLDLMQVEFNNLNIQRKKAENDIVFLEEELRQVKRRLLMLG